MDLTKEENKNVIMKYINKYKLELAQEQSNRKEVEEKLFNEKQSRLLVEQRLTEKEFLLTRKCEEIEHLEFKVDSLQKKLEEMEHAIKSKGQKGFGLFGKMFNGKQIEQISLQLKEYEEEIEIKTEEIERLHQLIFDQKRELSAKDEHYSKQVGDVKQELSLVAEQLHDQKAENKDLARKLVESENVVAERQDKIQELIKLLQEKEDFHSQLKNKVSIQAKSLAEMENTLVRKNDDLAKLDKEMQFMSDATIYLRDQLKHLTAKLELELETINSDSLALIVKEIKTVVENKFGADMDKEKRKILIKNEKLITEEILRGHLITQMRLEKQNGKLVPVNTILDNQIGLNQQALEVFEKAKEKILKLGKLNEAQEKKTKILNDKLQILEAKKGY